MFNVQSCLPDVHDRLVGFPGRLRLTLSSIESALDAGLHVECHVVPHKRNLDSLEQTGRELLDMGVQRVSFLRLVPQGYAEANRNALLCSPDEERRMVETFRALMAQPEGRSRYRFGVPFSGRCGPETKCHAGQSKLIMRWDGVFFPCEAFKECGHSEFELGHIIDGDLGGTLRRARASVPLQLLKRRALGVDPCPAQCLYAA